MKFENSNEVVKVSSDKRELTAVELELVQGGGQLGGQALGQAGGVVLGTAAKGVGAK